MKVYGYGEDALTLWALANRLEDILEQLGDESKQEDCQVFYRPSFGRSGGENSSQFGEFDFVVLSKNRLYLGESKWDRSSLRIKDGVVLLDETQAKRHRVFKAYVEHCAFGDCEPWEEFKERSEPLIGRPIPGEDSLLASNLKEMMKAIREYYHGLQSSVEPVDVLLYLHRGQDAERLPRTVTDDFKLACINYSQAEMLGNYITIEM
jgi:hypothetical protein